MLNISCIIIRNNTLQILQRYHTWLSLGCASGKTTSEEDIWALFHLYDVVYPIHHSYLIVVSCKLLRNISDTHMQL